MEALSEMKKQVENIRRDVMVELHTTKYDLLKEMALLKGSVLRLVDALDNRPTSPVAVSETSTEPSTDDDDYSTSDEANRDSVVVAPYLPKTSSQRASTKKSLRHSPSSSLRESTRLSTRTSVARVKETALTEPFEKLIEKHLPRLDTKPKLRMLSSTRKWAVEAFHKWKNNPQVQVLAVIGAHGTGKSTFLQHLVDTHPNDILASHFCRFDRTVDTTRIVISLARQIAATVPAYQEQLKRLNLPYLVQEPDAVILATKLLIEPLHAIEEMVPQHVIVLDGIDHDDSLPSTRLLDLLSAVALEFPPWLPPHGKIMFDMKNKDFAADCGLLVDAMMRKHKDMINRRDDQVMALLKAKSGGSCIYLEFVDHAFALSAEDVDVIDAGMVLQLPNSVDAIYATIFEDKYGKGRKRIWQKAQPVLEMIVAATKLSYQKPSQPYVTEAVVEEMLKYTKADLTLVRRSFSDIVSVREGVYRVENKALVDWLTSQKDDAPLQINAKKRSVRFNI
ncbi:hypothetical protein LEN26_005394 [Aphanomyces euteiches]|nr:hypothetical protein AeMF1_000262 [Aphanomyces euteiches]KAH9138079.1 hypothetical protein LEN26_005394 [Aphanomyces euteiches]KAH9197325.1 hypothetical protein AeNC1_000670 [Aphanomyces euteiches]